ncbi:FUSC family membrane protein [Vogesella sp. AC12]|uniref:FUSC family protein n=1 Tax=Vogesella sp. AC12 TaxID=2950550 RepID=UPI00210C5BD7|nr:FUSC family membrane protein [Vogesella sp. AC12]MCQ4145218.1 FUSC family protein [Vogesella sp. AC12]
MPRFAFAPPHPRLALRVALSHHVANGLSAALGLLLISAAVHLWLGALAAAAASVGVVVCIPPDQPAPRRGKLRQLLPAALLGLPLFLGTRLLHGDALQLGLLLLPATFIAFLAAAWGKRGIPLSVSIMFAMLFAMAMPAHDGTAPVLASSLHFALGAGLYLLWATLANALLNGRYRVQLLADTLLALAELMQLQAQQFLPPDSDERRRAPLIGRLLREQAALTDQLQSARNILLESPRTPRRQQLAAMLLQVLEMRDHLLACELDLDALKSRPGHAPVLGVLHEVLQTLAADIAQLADKLLYGRTPSPVASLRPLLATLHWAEAEAAVESQAPSAAMLARGLANRVGNINDEVVRLVALARGEQAPDLTGVRASWQLFVSPTAWSWRPFAGLWRWDAPPLRHAIRAALAVGAAYALAQVLPWVAHDYWILLTIVVVLRGSLAQTLERRNSRVAGTLLGCVIAGALLALQPSSWLLLLAVTLAQAFAHAFAVRRYLVTAVAATVLGLLQAHMLHAGASPVFGVPERIADTLLGVAIAWACSYVLPSWERHQIPALVARTLSAQARHARVALGLGQLQAIDNEPELAWRLARREAYDSLSALVQATQRSLAEPRAVRPPLAPLGLLLAHSYQLLAQLTAVKSMLLLRRDRLQPEQIRQPLQQAAQSIDSTLQHAGGAAVAAAEAAPGPVLLPDPFESDLSPWLLRRLELATRLAGQLRQDADQVLAPPVRAKPAAAPEQG